MTEYILLVHSWPVLLLPWDSSQAVTMSKKEDHIMGKNVWIRGQAKMLICTFLANTRIPMLDYHLIGTGLSSVQILPFS